MSLLRVSSSAAGDRAALLDVANCHETRVDVSTVAVTRPGCDRRPPRSHGEVTLQVSPRDETLEVTFVSCRRVAHLVRLSGAHLFLRFRRDSHNNKYTKVHHAKKECNKYKTTMLGCLVIRNVLSHLMAIVEEKNR